MNGAIKKTPFIGLPGNPVAAIVTILMLVTDYLRKFSGINKFETKGCWRFSFASYRTKKTKELFGNRSFSWSNFKKCL